jgi:glycerol kinase
VETTALGAAYFAGLATGYWRDKNEIKVNAAIDRIFKPEISDLERRARLGGWKKAVGRSFDWAEE